jgi:hypothetical protein
MSEIGTISIMFEELKQMLKRLETNLTNKTNQESSISTTDIQRITERFYQSEKVILDIPVAAATSYVLIPFFFSNSAKISYDEMAISESKSS